MKAKTNKLFSHLFFRDNQLFPNYQCSIFTMATAKVQAMPEIFLSSSNDEETVTTVTKRRKSRTTRKRQSESCQRLSEPKTRRCHELTRQATQTFTKRETDRKPQVSFEAFAAPKRPFTMPPRRPAREPSANRTSNQSSSSSATTKKTPSAPKGKKSRSKSKSQDESSSQRVTRQKKVVEEKKPLERKSTKSQTRKKGDSKKDTTDGLNILKTKKRTSKESTQILADTAAGGVKVDTPTVQNTLNTATQKVQEAKAELIQKALNLSEKNPDDDQQCLILREIVDQSERDKKIFGYFERIPHYAQPMREELTRRGWIEYMPSQFRLLMNAQPRRVSGNAKMPKYGKNHTEEAIAHFHVNGTTNFHATQPGISEASAQRNLKIFQFEIQHGTHGILAAELREKIKSMPKQEKITAISKIIEEYNTRISFVLLARQAQAELQNLPYVPSIGNMLQSTNFCSKLGLMDNLSLNERLIPTIGVQFPVKYPRMYNLAMQEDAFVLDFKITAVVSLLRWFVDNQRNTGEESVFDKNGTIKSTVIEMAIKKAKKITSFWKTRDPKILENLINEPDWEIFLNQYHEISHENGKLEAIQLFPKANLHLRAKMTLDGVKIYQPEMDHDGYSNLWIVKPYSSACGRGIFLTNNLDYLQQLPVRKYIVQKYIERPHLIHQTKYDIRQWFLITSLLPLEFWIYKDCYLRFCCTPYDTKNLHEAVHLTNNAIQDKYYRGIIGQRFQTMWDSATFQKYLQENDQPELWQNRIFPGMRDALICALYCSQHTFDATKQREGWYQLYGADFMLTSDLSEGPWLIEINNGPALGRSSPVTAALTNQMLRDIVKVVVDRRDDVHADTGGWILAYRQTESETLTQPA